MKNRMELIKPYLFIAPALLCLSAFTLYPALRQLFLSFFNADALLSRLEFVGLSHYRAMAASGVFWETARNTAVFGGLLAFCSVAVGLACALAANRAANGGLGRAGSLFRAAVFYPYVLPWSAAAMVWLYLLHPARGAVNALLGVRVQWFSDFRLSLYVLVFVSVWKNAGFAFLLFLAGLRAIPAELYESLRLDCGGRLRAFWHITLPMLGPAFFAAGLLLVAGGFQSADLVYLATQGRPGNSTNLLVYHIYETGIARRNIGYGSALGTVLFLALLLFAAAYVLLGEKRVHYDE